MTLFPPTIANIEEVSFRVWGSDATDYPRRLTWLLMERSRLLGCMPRLAMQLQPAPDNRPFALGCWSQERQAVQRILRESLVQIISRSDMIQVSPPDEVATIYRHLIRDWTSDLCNFPRQPFNSPRAEVSHIHRITQLKLSLVAVFVMSFLLSHLLLLHHLGPVGINYVESRLEGPSKH